MEDFLDKFEIKIGDFILITGNLIKFIKKAKKIDKEFNLNLLSFNTLK
ncbi:hypothetical protein [Campylobacter pinnipediorum]|nr:hypothetical protein [Campylobacter pinnipediorum]